MARYHINPKTGNAGICRAVKTCPFGDVKTEHFDTRWEAIKAFEEGMVGQAFSTSASKNNTSPQNNNDKSSPSADVGKANLIRRRTIVAESKEGQEFLRGHFRSSTDAAEAFELLKAGQKASLGQKEFEEKLKEIVDRGTFSGKLNQTDYVAREEVSNDSIPPSPQVSTPATTVADVAAVILNKRVLIAANGAGEEILRGVFRKAVDARDAEQILQDARGGMLSQSELADRLEEVIGRGTFSGTRSDLLAADDNSAQPTVASSQVDSGKFIYAKDEKIFLADASDLRGTALAPTSELLAQSFNFRSAKSGAVVPMKLAQVGKDGENETTHWDYTTDKSIDPSAPDLKVRIFND